MTIDDWTKTLPMWTCYIALHRLYDLSPGVLQCRDCKSEFADPATC